MVLRDTADHSVVTVQVTDAGHDNQILALATITPCGRTRSRPAESRRQGGEG
jgi:hypothetical protein